MFNYNTFNYGFGANKKWMWDAGTSTAQAAVDTGQNAINSFNPTATSGSTRSSFDTLYGNQTNAGAQFAGQYAADVAKNPDVTKLYSNANEAFNVPQLASNAAYLQNQVTNQLPMQQNLMRGFDASQGQVDNATNYNLRFLEPQATAATNQSQTAQTLAGQQVQAGITQNQMNLLPVQAQQQLLLQAQASQATGYDTAAQQEMAGLIAKVNAGVQLSATEMSRANQLSSQEEAYNQALAVAKQNQQYQNVKAGDTLYNTFTNQHAVAGAK